jgi:hypothetical protein
VMICRSRYFQSSIDQGGMLPQRCINALPPRTSVCVVLATKMFDAVLNQRVRPANEVANDKAAVG